MIFDFLLIGTLAFFEFYKLMFLSIAVGAVILFLQKNDVEIRKNYQFRSRVEGIYGSEDGRYMYITTYPYIEGTKRLYCFNLLNAQFVPENDRFKGSGLTKILICQRKLEVDFSLAENYPPEYIGEGLRVLQHASLEEKRDWIIRDLLSEENKRRHVLTEEEEIYIENEKDPNLKY